MYDRRITKENLDTYLKELAKEYRKRNGKNMPAEIILIGGASVVINYGFREMTYDLDAIINASFIMKEAINNVGDKYNLPNGWLNDDFIKTDSYSSNIVQYSKHYHTYSNVVTFRTITGEYLLAMKLKSGRKYKHDQSDIIGILWEQERMGRPLTLKNIKKAVVDLYGSYDAISSEMKDFIEVVMMDGSYKKIYDSVRKNEMENKKVLIEYDNEKPDVVNKDNANDIINSLRKRINKK